MAKKSPLLLLLLAAGVVWWLFVRRKDTTAALVNDVTTGTPAPVPAFGTDQIIDAADATAVLQLQLPRPAPYDPFSQAVQQSYIGKIS
jgi:hypothetical protein